MRALIVFAYVVGDGAAAVLPSLMKAGVVTKPSRDMKVHLENIKEIEVSVPSVRNDQVLVEVQGSSVNPVDWKLIEIGGVLPPISAGWSYPHILGRDFAGKVAAIGSKVTKFRVGDTVWGDNSEKEGTFANYVAVNESIVGHAPTSIPLAEAATLPLVSLTGLEAYNFAKAPWQSKPTVVVLGGSGGTGHTGIQLAKALGAGKVISTCGTDHVAFCKSVGADQVIDYHKEDWHEVVANKSVDIVYDTVAIKGTGDLAYDVLKDGGTFVTLLDDSLASKAAVSKRPSIRQEAFLLSHIQTTYLDTLKDFVDKGKLHGHIDQVFSFAQVADAVNASMGGHTTGKISVVPNIVHILV